jgi:hypothetical protein
MTAGVELRLASPGLAFLVVADLVESLMGIPGVVAVARAGREHAAGPRPRGKPAYLLYYRGTLDLGELRKLAFEGDVEEPCVGGHVMNGDATLTIEGRRMDVIYRDLDAVEHWMAEANEGRFEIDAVDGWLAGMPTYVLVGELATCEALAGELPRPEFPAALRESSTRRWRDTAARALEVAGSLASRGDVAGCSGLLAKAAVATAEARLARARGVGPGRGWDRPARGGRTPPSLLDPAFRKPRTWKGTPTASCCSARACVAGSNSDLLGGSALAPPVRAVGLRVFPEVAGTCLTRRLPCR